MEWNQHQTCAIHAIWKEIQMAAHGGFCIFCGELLLAIILREKAGRRPRIKLPSPHFLSGGGFRPRARMPVLLLGHGFKPG